MKPTNYKLAEFLAKGHWFVRAQVKMDHIATRRPLQEALCLPRSS